MKKLNRREFIETLAGMGAALFAAGCSEGESDPAAKSAQAVAPKPPKFDPKQLAVASGREPGRVARAAVEALGGMSKLVRKGDFVVIKPNIAWNRPANAAATTDPQVVAELVRMCREAGAAKVLVIDHIIDRPAAGVLGLSGIQAAAEKAGAEVYAAQSESDYRTIEVVKGKLLTSDTCIKDILKADVLINVPIAKTHSSTRLTLGLKNLMGCIWDRQAWHQSASLDQCIADYVTAIRPDLTVLDANRILLTNGPKGPGETKDVQKVVAGVDPVAIDAYGATLFGMKAQDIAHIKRAHELGAGEIDLSKVNVKKV